MQAVVKIGSSQYFISPGQEILADKNQIDQVLLVIDDGTVHVGQPEVAGVQVKIADLGPVKGEKVRVFKYKAKSRYRKTRGFRAQYHRLKIQSIALS